MIRRYASENDFPVHGKHMATRSGVIKIAILFFSAFFCWQLSGMEALPAIGDSHAKRYQGREEVRLYKQPIPTPPDFAVMYFHQGLRYYDLGDWQKAIAAFAEAAEVKPDYAVAYFGLGTAYSRLEIWDDAMAVEIDPYYAEAYLGLGIAYSILGFSSEAINALRMAVEIKPGYGQAHYALALGYLMLSDEAAALEQYGILKSLDPNLADQLIHLIKNK